MNAEVNLRAAYTLVVQYRREATECEERVKQLHDEWRQAHTEELGRLQKAVKRREKAELALCQAALELFAGEGHVTPAYHPGTPRTIVSKILLWLEAEKDE